MTSSSKSKFRSRLLEGKQALLGTFIKTPSPHAIEIVGAVGFDFVIIDAEHAPFDRGSIDLAILAARAVGIASLVRVAEANAASILAALDDGASGVLVPHVDSKEKALAVAAWSRYRGRRGFSNSPRAGNYGAHAMWEHVDAADDEVSVIAMIEDPDAIACVDDIMSVPGIDAYFIGRGDLAVALNDRVKGAPAVSAATDRIIDAAARAGRPVMLMENDPALAIALRQKGVHAFVVGSDQAFLRNSAGQALHAFRRATGTQPEAESN